MTLPPRILFGRRAARGRSSRRWRSRSGGRVALIPLAGADLLRRAPAHRLGGQAARGVAGGARVSTFVPRPRRLARRLVLGARDAAARGRRPPGHDADADRSRRALRRSRRRASTWTPTSTTCCATWSSSGLVGRHAGRPTATPGFVAFGAAEKAARGDRPAGAARRVHPARRRDDGRPRRRARRPVPRRGRRRCRLARPPRRRPRCSGVADEDLAVGGRADDAAAGADATCSRSSSPARSTRSPTRCTSRCTSPGLATLEESQAPDRRVGMPTPSWPAAHDAMIAMRRPARAAASPADRNRVRRSYAMRRACNGPCRTPTHRRTDSAAQAAHAQGPTAASGERSCDVSAARLALAARRASRGRRRPCAVSPRQPRRRPVVEPAALRAAWLELIADARVTTGHGGWCWERVTPLLRGRRPPRHDADAHRARRALRPRLGGRRPRHAHRRRAAAPRVRAPVGRRPRRPQLRRLRRRSAWPRRAASNIASLVLLDAFIPLHGETMADHVGERGDQYRAARRGRSGLAGARAARRRPRRRRRRPDAGWTA